MQEMRRCSGIIFRLVITLFKFIKSGIKSIKKTHYFLNNFFSLFLSPSLSIYIWRKIEREKERKREKKQKEREGIWNVLLFPCNQVLYAE